MTENVYITLKDNLMQRFLANKVLLTNEFNIQIDNGKRNTIETSLYDGFKIINVNKIVDLIVIPRDSKIFIYRDFIDVTNNSRYYINNILNGTVYLANLVLEGTDGVGKTTIAKALALRGILCEDRCVQHITKNMKPEICQEIRIREVRNYLQNNPQKKIVFLYLSNLNELIRRIYNRVEVSDYDKQALIFQSLYLETYSILKDYSNLYLIDCLNKSVDDMVEEILKLK